MLLCICTCISCTMIHTIVYMYTVYTGSRDGLENHMHTQTEYIGTCKANVKAGPNGLENLQTKTVQASFNGLNLNAVQASLNGLENLNQNAVQASLNSLENLT